MSGGRCWSSIVATPDERAALGLGADGEWLVGCVLREGHPGAHASDGAQAHHGRRRWLVWGDFARGAQMLRDEDPCPVTELDGSACLYYLGHSGPHRYPTVEEIVPIGRSASPMDRPMPVVGPAHRGFPPTQPWSAPTAFDLDPEPPTDQFPALPAPSGWPNAAPQPTAFASPVESAGALGTSSMDRLFAELPSLASNDTPIAPPNRDPWTVPQAPARAPESAPAAPELDPTPEFDPELELDPGPDLEPVPAAALDRIPELDAVATSPVGAPTHAVEGFVASHRAPDIEEAQIPPTSSGPTRFEPIEFTEDADGGSPHHQPVKVVNDYEPSLSEDTPGGATTVVYRDDPDASSMEVRPTSNDVLTTSILQVIASNGDPVRIGVPTTVRPISGPARTADLTGEQLSGDDVKAMTEAVRDAAERLRTDPGADDTQAIGEALRDMASSLARLADRFGK